MTNGEKYKTEKEQSEGARIERDMLKTIEGLQEEVNKYVEVVKLLRDVERRSRYIVMLRENGMKHEPAWNELVKALNAMRMYELTNKDGGEK